MQELEIKTNPKVRDVFKNYPPQPKEKLLRLRELILNTAKTIEGINAIEETLKWGEPSYITKHGSTLRMDWKEKLPNQYAMYFSCSSSLVPTFKIVFKTIFEFEGKRAIKFNLNDDIPENEIKQCIKTTLTYHKVKHLPLLGL